MNRKLNSNSFQNKHTKCTLFKFRINQNYLMIVTHKFNLKINTQTKLNHEQKHI
ncbi:uncharacterized protein DS421_4g108340 [Arachis hypogaea]|nr:uncharacterized protein DS421_4g108340 [Arachis hypogaea]